MKRRLSRSGLTCAGGGVAFTQFLRQLGHFAAYRFVAAQGTVFRDGVILGGSERPVVVLLGDREQEMGVRHCVIWNVSFGV